MYVIGIVEDEKENQDNIVSLLEQFSSNKKIGFQYKIYSSSEEYIFDSVKVDILLLDIGLPKLDGMNLARQIREKAENTPIVFVTNLRQYALEGYEVSACGFIMKPATYYAVELALMRAIKNLEASNSGHLVLRQKSGTVYILHSDILYVEVSSHTTFIYSKEKTFEAHVPLSEIEKSLPKNAFIRVSNSAIVNVANITSLQGSDILMGDRIVLVSRRYRKTVMDHIVTYYGRK